MPAPSNLVRPQIAPSKSSVSSALAMGWARAANSAGKGAMADIIGACPKTINRALIGENLPELHTALASMLADESALDEVFSLYGLQRPRRKNSEASNDLVTVSCLSNLVSAFCEAISDGKRDHNETLVLADLVRAAMPSLTAILDDADRIRGVAA